MGSDHSLRLRVEDVLCDCAAALDEERFDAWPGFVAQPQCRNELLSRENVDLGLPVPLMSGDSQGMVSDRMAMLIMGTRTFRPMRQLRQVSNVRSARQPDDSIAGRAGGVVFQSDEEGVSSLYIVARLEVRLVEPGAALQISQMRVVVDSFGTDAMLAVPH